LIETATIAISLDEPAFELKELNLQGPPAKGWRRYQLIRVVRSDRLATFKEDLGPAKDFTVDQFQIPAWVMDDITGRVEIFHTVGQLREIADTMRLGIVDTHREIETPDLWSDWLNQQEHLWSMSAHGLRTHSIPGRPAIPLTEMSG
tara:strand:- start:1312 stop:1752 length:441 start_codon:yes stop_codon:yes gene_type:complete